MTIIVLPFFNQEMVDSYAYIASEFLQLTDEAYPVKGVTGEIVSINGTIVSLITKDMHVSLKLLSNGSEGTDWELVDTKPSATFPLAANNEFHYEFKIHFLKHGTFFFQPKADILEIQNASGSWTQRGNVGESRVITILGEDVAPNYPLSAIVYTVIVAVLAGIFLIYIGIKRRIKKV